MVTASPCGVVARRTALPEPTADECVVEVVGVALCGTDAHIWAGDYAAAALPLVQGHEVVGRTADGLVVIDPARSCGRCRACRVGRANACTSMSVLGIHADGALAEAIVVPRAATVTVDDLPWRTATLVEPASIALRAVGRAGPVAGERVLVLGAGPIGLLATRAFADLGADVVVHDRSPARAARGPSWGASAVVGPDGFDEPAVVLDATGSAGGLESAVGAAAHAGVVVTVGVADAASRITSALIAYKELDLRGSRNGTGLTDAIAFTRRHRALVDGLVTHEFPLGRAGEALALAAAAPDDLGKVIVSTGALR